MKEEQWKEEEHHLDLEEEKKQLHTLIQLMDELGYKTFYSIEENQEVMVESVERDRGYVITFVPQNTNMEEVMKDNKEYYAPIMFNFTVERTKSRYGNFLKLENGKYVIGKEKSVMKLDWTNKEDLEKLINMAK